MPGHKLQAAEFVLDTVTRLNPGAVSPVLPACEGGGISNHSNKKQQPQQLAVVSSPRRSRRTAHALFMKKEASGGLRKKEKKKNQQPGSKILLGALACNLVTVQSIRNERQGRRMEA